MVFPGVKQSADPLNSFNPLPAGFRDEFAGEMELVFARRILEVGLCGRKSLLRQFVLELLALPGLYLLTYQRHSWFISLDINVTS